MLANIILIIVGMIVLHIVSFLLLVAAAHRKVTQGKALIRAGYGGTKVAYDSGMFVIPAFHKVEELDTTIKRIPIRLTAADNVRSKDKIHLEIEVLFFVHIEKNKDAILEVASWFGCAATHEEARVKQVFQARFEEAVRNVVRKHDFSSLDGRDERVLRELREEIGADLHGYALEAIAISSVQKLL